MFFLFIYFKFISFRGHIVKTVNYQFVTLARTITINEATTLHIDKTLFLAEKSINRLQTIILLILIQFI